MGRRAKKAPVVTKKRPTLAKRFKCPFCANDDTVECKMDFKAGIGSLACRLCAATYQMPIHHLHEPVDVFSEWLDDCEAAAMGKTTGGGSSSAGASGGGGTSASHVPRYQSEDEEDDDEELPEASGLSKNAKNNTNNNKKKNAASNNNKKKPASKAGGGGARDGRKPSYTELGLDDSDDDDDSDED